MLYVHVIKQLVIQLSGYNNMKEMSLLSYGNVNICLVKY